MKAYVTFDTSHADQVEANIHPPMQLAVTIPVEVTFPAARKPYTRQVIVYICASAFGPPLNGDEFEAAVAGIVEQLEAREG